MPPPNYQPPKMVPDMPDPVKPAAVPKKKPPVDPFSKRRREEAKANGGTVRIPEGTPPVVAGSIRGDEAPYFDHTDIAARDPAYMRLMAEQVERVAVELAARRRETLRLYEPLAHQQKFHASNARIRLIRGGNRGAKSTGACVEVARAVTGTDPFKKYPATDGIVYIIGKDYRHNGTTLLPKLIGNQAIRIIRDRVTGVWRSFRPHSPEDYGRDMETKSCEPLIPRRFIKKIAWKNKANKEPLRIDLTTGWVIHFYSGEGDPMQGAAADIIYLDEEIKNSNWFIEAQARVADRNGRIFWAATPQNSTHQFYELHVEAENQVGQANPTVEEFHAPLADNPHVSDRAKKDMAASWSPEEQLVRIHGEFSLGGRRVYPDYRLLVNGIHKFDVPAHWTRYLSIDPGFQVCAVLFAACPPPEEVRGDPYKFVLYDELYLLGCNAEALAKAIVPKVQGLRFQDFLIDDNGSRVHQAGPGRTIYDQYADAFKKHSLKSIVSGHQFTRGSSDLKGGIELTRRALGRNDFHGPDVRVMCVRQEKGLPLPVLTNFEFEVNRYMRKVVVTDQGEIVTDDTDERGRVHQMANLRYLVGRQPVYVTAGVSTELHPSYTLFLKEQAKKQKQNRNGLGGKTVFGPASMSQPVGAA